MREGKVTPSAVLLPKHLCDDLENDGGHELVSLC